MHMVTHASTYIHNPHFVMDIMALYTIGGRGMSFVSYLYHILREDTWGDSLCVSALCHMFTCNASILYPEEGNRVFNIRHNGGLGEADLALMLTRGNHYSPIGRSLRRVFRGRR